MMISEEKISNLREELAAIEHERWSHWQIYLHGKCEINDDGSLTIPKDLVEQWERQSRTDFKDLEEKEKESDREQVDKYLPILKNFFEE